MAITMGALGAMSLLIFYKSFKGTRVHRNNSEEVRKLVIRTFVIPSSIALLVSIYLQFTTVKQILLFTNAMFYPVKLALFSAAPIYAFLTYLMIDWDNGQYAYSTRISELRTTN